MRIAHFDAAAGASGDMVLGALVDAGLPFDDLRDALANLAVEGYELSAEPVVKRGVAATKVTVALDDRKQPHRHLRHVVEIIDQSELDARVRERAKAVFTRLAEAEAKVHGTTIEKVHFHEVGAVDAIVDVVGACLGLAMLGIERVTCSPLPISHGWVDCAHGRLPVPAWATVELLQGAPTRPLDVAGETLTPTGAALLTTLADGYGQPPMVPRRIGYGAGAADFGIPNVLRLIVGDAVAGGAEPAAEADLPAAQVVVIETNLDDMNPEWYEPVVRRLFAAGALDVTLAPMFMKKGRPGVRLQVIAEPARRATLAEVLLRETTTLGVRWYGAERTCLAREVSEVTTEFGVVQVKLGYRPADAAAATGNGARDGGEELLTIAPEYESCRAVAEASGASLPTVHAAAYEAARRLYAPSPSEAAASRDAQPASGTT